MFGFSNCPINVCMCVCVGFCLFVLFFFRQGLPKLPWLVWNSQRSVCFSLGFLRFKVHVTTPNLYLLLCFEIPSHWIAWQASKSPSSCLCLLSIQITGSCHHTQLPVIFFSFPFSPSSFFRVRVLSHGSACLEFTMQSKVALRS